MLASIWLHAMSRRPWYASCVGLRSWLGARTIMWHVLETLPASKAVKRPCIIVTKPWVWVETTATAPSDSVESAEGCCGSEHQVTTNNCVACMSSLHVCREWLEGRHTPLILVPKRFSTTAGCRRTAQIMSLHACMALWRPSPCMYWVLPSDRGAPLLPAMSSSNVFVLWQEGQLSVVARRAA